jgi:protein SCO1/2
MNDVPIQRVVLRGFLVATLLAIVVTAVMAPRWSAPVGGALPPILGQAPDFDLVNRDGTSISNADLRGSPWVADFIFTRCGQSCPRMTAAMIRLGNGLPKDSEVYRVSFTVDPEHDTPEVLQAFAETWGIDDSRWLFLTGDMEAIHRMVVEGFKLALDVEPPPEIFSSEEPILQSGRFVLVDSEGAIRGYYSVVEGGELQRLIDDLRALRAN